MTEQRNQSFLSELEQQTASFTDEEFARFLYIMERRGRAAAPAIATTIDAASVQPTNAGMFMPSTMPELRGRDNLG